MAIVQQDPARVNNKVVIDPNNPAVLQILQHQLPNGAVVQPQSIDLTDYQGQPFRLYVEEDGRLNIALDGVHYWLLAEAVIPEREFDSQETSEVDEHGSPIVTHVERPLDLRNVDIVVYPWPEETGEEDGDAEVS